MTESFGKFGDADPEVSTRSAANNIVTPPVDFNTLHRMVMKARAGGPVRYNSIWLALEALIIEVARLRTEVDTLRSK